MHLLKHPNIAIIQRHSTLILHIVTIIKPLMADIMAQACHQRKKHLKLIHKLLQSRLLMHLIEHHHHCKGVGEVVEGHHIVLLAEVA